MQQAVFTHNPRPQGPTTYRPCNRPRGKGNVAPPCRGCAAPNRSRLKRPPTPRKPERRGCTLVEGARPSALSPRTVPRGHPWCCRCPHLFSERCPARAPLADAHGMLPSKCIHSPGTITTMDPFTATAPKPSAALTGPTAHAVHKLTMDGLYIQPRQQEP